MRGGVKMNRKQAITKLDEGLAYLEVPPDAEERIRALERELFDVNPFDFGTNFFEEHTKEEIQAQVKEHDEKFRRVERELNQLKKRKNPKLRLQLLIKIRLKAWNNGYWNDEIDPSITCLLYTSDAADDLTRVDLGGRRIIKKKKTYNKKKIN